MIDKLAGLDNAFDMEKQSNDNIDPLRKCRKCMITSTIPRAAKQNIAGRLVKAVLGGIKSHTVFSFFR